MSFFNLFMLMWSGYSLTSVKLFVYAGECNNSSILMHFKTADIVQNSIILLDV